MTPDMSAVSKKSDTLVARMMEACEKEGATLLEVKLASTRFQRAVDHRIEELEAEAAFTAPPQKEN